mmetsp:Transcript_74677/g.242673  ORF Transcript_74677/g.242673 Transcript_74677/m.242673 type:complete len:115 (-) Transcript_74677:323-667(-)
MPGPDRQSVELGGHRGGEVLGRSVGRGIGEERGEPGFNIRAAALFLRGTEDKPSVPSLRISALGGVIAAAAAVAASVESEGLGRIVKVQTAYLERPSGRACPQIFIDIDRVAKA